MRTKFAALLALAPGMAFAGVAGQWDFNGNLNATVGSAATGTNDFAFENAQIGGHTAQVARFDCFQNPTDDAYFTITNPIGANGGGTRTNQYTLVMDVMFPATPGYVALYQTAAGANADDADWFIHRSSDGMGISGDYTDTGNALRFTDNVWHRIALVIDTTSATGDACLYRSYVDGVLQNVVQTPSGWGVDARFSLGNTLYLFADEDGETAPTGYINSAQLRDYAMSASEVAGLGGASASGIPLPLSVNSYSVHAGSIFSGGLSKLTASDDQKLSLFDDTDTLEAALDVTLGSPVASISALSLKVESAVSRPGLSLSVQLLSNSAHDYVEVTSGDGTLSDSVLEVQLNSGATDYIAGGLVKARLDWAPFNDEVPSQDGWLHFVDYIGGQVSL